MAGGALPSSGGCQAQVEEEGSDMVAGKRGGGLLKMAHAGGRIIGGSSGDVRLEPVLCGRVAWAWEGEEGEEEEEEEGRAVM